MSGQACPHCTSKEHLSDFRPKIIGFGSFIRQSDLSRQKRYRCLGCKKTFSDASRNLCFGQKKRHLNPNIFEAFASGVSQRRLTKILRVNRKTIVRKFIFLGLVADRIICIERKLFPPVKEMQFDDLETFEHSKLKPLSVTMAVEKNTRRILGFSVARMPAKGLLVKRSLKKYGRRSDERKYFRDRLFKEIRECLAPAVVIESDSNPHYLQSVKKHFPEAQYLQYLGRRGCVVGQGELKSGGFDPLFSLNHSFAMLRANINRLFRRTWNTTKKPEMLALHIAIYSLYHNKSLI